MAKRIEGMLRAFRPTSVSLGYALFLAVNATGVWGGVFPFFPFTIQTPDVMFWFYFAQSLSLFVIFFLCARMSYHSPTIPPNKLVLASSWIYFGGWGCLIASLYLRAWILPLAIGGGLLLGVGSGAFYLLWQQLFASQEAQRGMRDLIVGFVYAALAYFGLHLLPHAVTAYLIPLVFLPVFALALILANRTIDFEQSMFSDKPKENRRVYLRAIRGMWRSAICMGAIAFCTGLIRSVAIEQPEIGSAVNLLSMAALLAGAAALLLLWHLKNLRLNLIKLYQIVFPVIISAFLILPFAWRGYVHVLAAGLYALYSIGLLLAMVQCAQISRDRGIHPIFSYGIFGGIVYFLHDFGFIVGRIGFASELLHVEPTMLAAVSALYLLALMFFVSSVNFRNSTSQFLYGDTIELFSPHPQPMGAEEDARPGIADVRRRDEPGAEGEGPLRDRVSKQVARLRRLYQLTEREAEIAELVARGNTVPRMSELLLISENTIRTHMKHLYAKVDAHKKDDLLELMDREA